VNRPRKTKGPYPPCFYEKHGAFYLEKANMWARLGSDLALALAEYGRLVRAPTQKGMPQLIDDVLKHIEPKLAQSTRDQRLQLIMQLQYLTGQRIGDVLAIKRSRLTDEGIHFKQQKTGARRLVRRSPDLKAAVKAAKALSGDVPSIALLRSTKGGPPDHRSASEQFARAAAAAGVEDARLNERAREVGHGDEQAGPERPGAARPHLRDTDRPLPPGPRDPGRRRAHPAENHPQSAVRFRQPAEN
jgi:integrase